MNKTILSAILATACVVSLSACSGGGKEVSQPVTPTEYPALTTENVDNVLQSLSETLSAADSAKDKAKLEPRLSGPALQMRAGQYAVAAKNRNYKLQTIPTKAESLTVTSSTDWPRAIIDVTEAQKGQLPYLLVIRQPDANSQYKLWTWARVLPGAQVPGLAVVNKGSRTIKPDESKAYLKSPQDALKNWGAVALNAKDKQAESYEVDVLMKTIREEIKKLRTAINNENGEVSASLTPEDDLVAIETAQGKALVIGTYNLTIAIKAKNRSITVTGNPGVLLGNKATFSDAASWNNKISVAMVVPDATSKEKIKVIAGEKIITSVKSG